jgi:nitroimidazol reductase NimA-like FMN-containing flavoprotein (pyridoxamine 5'-phosphate oxidase superfamily)
MTTTLTPTDRTRLKRKPERGSYDLATIHAILDAAVICHVAYTLDGQPFAMPMAFGRVGNRLYVHAASVGRMPRAAAEGLDLCLTVTLVDGLVLGRSAMHHSMNYRCVIAIGRARLVSDPVEKETALRAVVNHNLPGRWDQVRSPSTQEMKATGVLALELDEASAKVRTGGPVDNDEDYTRAVWAGVIPLHTTFGRPEDDGRVLEGVAPFDVGRLT